MKKKKEIRNRSLTFISSNFPYKMVIDLIMQSLRSMVIGMNMIIIIITDTDLISNGKVFLPPPPIKKPSR